MIPIDAKENPVTEVQGWPFSEIQTSLEYIWNFAAMVHDLPINGTANFVLVSEHDVSTRHLHVIA